MALGTFLQFHTEKFGEEKNLKQLLKFFFGLFYVCLFFLERLKYVEKESDFLFPPAVSLYISVWSLSEN